VTVALFAGGAVAFLAVGRGVLRHAAGPERPSARAGLRYTLSCRPLRDLCLQSGLFNLFGAATDLARRWDIRGVYAVGEMMVEQTGVLADALGLPAPGLRATRACRSKYLQRLLCPEWGPPMLLFPPGHRSARHGEHPASRRCSSRRAGGPARGCAGSARSGSSTRCWRATRRPRRCCWSGT
jgi:hypothetical protein